MEITSKKDNSDVDRTGSIFVKFQAVTIFISSLISFFTFTEEDRLKAGIRRGSEGRGE